MKITKISLVLGMFLTGVLLFTSCSKDKADDLEQEMQEGIATAMIEFLDTKEKVQFSGTATGAIAPSSKDTLVMTFVGNDKPMQFVLVITPVSEGTHIMRESGFETVGAFFHGSDNYLNAYLVGEDNIDDNELEMDGEASFTISSLSNKNIKGTFELTMIRNTTIKEDGEIISGEIKRIKVTNGKFNVPFK